MTDQRPRYIKQRDHHSCGPVALLNALKWAGYKVSYNKHFRSIYRSCKCSDTGTFDCDFDSAIRRYRHLIVMPEDGPFEQPYIGLIDEHLDNGGAVVFSYIYKSCRGMDSHLSLCIGRSGKTYMFVNDSEFKPTICKRKRKTVVKMLKFKDDGVGSFVWFIERLNNIGKR